ncbi:MAG: MFS transporter [Pseudomonadota bacterium]
MAVLQAGAPMAMPSSDDAATAPQGWPSPGAAYYALAVLVLATFLNFLDSTVFMLMVERIKHDFLLSDEQLGWLLGPANIIFYVLVGIPLARLVDIYPRKLVLAGGLLLISTLNAAGGLAQNFRQLFGSRMLIGAGGSAHAPGAYSMLADYFPPARLPRAIAVLQLGFIGGTTIGLFIGGQLLAMVAGWEPMQWMGLTIRGWQWILLMLAVPGLAVVCMLLMIREPDRRGLARAGKAMPIGEVFAEIWRRKAVYLPLFIGLAFSALESLGLQAWRAPFLIRTYGWSEQQIGNWSAPMLLVSAVLGLFIGTALTEWLGKRHKDAHVRATTILFAAAVPCSVLAPLMPSGELALFFYALSGMFGLGSAIPQNAAIQRITPNEMRGQVTAIYLFMFTFFGAMGSLVIGTVNQRLVGGEGRLWLAMAATAAVLMPLAAITISFGIRPYRREIERVEAIERTGAAAT